MKKILSSLTLYSAGHAVHSLTCHGRKPTKNFGNRCEANTVGRTDQKTPKRITQLKNYWCLIEYGMISWVVVYSLEILLIFCFKMCNSMRSCHFSKFKPLFKSHLLNQIQIEMPLCQSPDGMIVQTVNGILPLEITSV